MCIVQYIVHRENLLHIDFLQVFFYIFLLVDN
jgi:hypothetical protein